jgi:hypothetical protein
MNLVVYSNGEKIKTDVPLVFCNENHFKNVPKLQFNKNTLDKLLCPDIKFLLDKEYIIEGILTDNIYEYVELTVLINKDFLNSTSLSQLRNFMEETRLKSIV